MSEDKIELTEEMVNTLENPPKANDAFKAAAKKYKGEDIKKADTTLWLDNNGYRTLDNFSKKELAYYHSSDVKTLKGVVDGLTQQVAELRAALQSVKLHQEKITPSGFEFSSVWQVANKALEEKQ